MLAQEKCRLVTRSDFDGLVCAMLLTDLGLIDEIAFVHPKDMQDGKIPISDRDITTNLPYVAGARLVFDHHASEILRADRDGGRAQASEGRENHVIDPDAPSAARVVYDYYGGADTFPSLDPDLMAAVDKADAARFTLEEVLHPKSWVLLNFLMDARTGLGRFHQFRISNYDLMMELIDACKRLSIEEVLTLPDVRERVDVYFQQEELFRAQLRRCSEVYENLVVVDLRGEEVIHAGNRFVVYALHPECNISGHVIPGKQGLNTVFAVGHSILNRSSQTRVGELMLRHGGGGHEAAGTCQVAHEDAERVLAELIETITTDG
ncbi:MAG: exopolyphosphatase [Actinomycetota bacterium]